MSYILPTYVIAGYIYIYIYIYLFIYLFIGVTAMKTSFL